ncbi:hypothetical protein AKJ47_01580, partial [candidate division MSBL1 archaeon SCGC-AAA261G05]
MSTFRSLNWKDFPIEAATVPFPIPERTPPVTNRNFVISKSLKIKLIKLSPNLGLLKIDTPEF